MGSSDSGSSRANRSRCGHFQPSLSAIGKWDHHQTSTRDKGDSNVDFRRSASSNRLPKGDPPGTLALEPTPPRAHHHGRQRIAAARRSLEPTARVTHRLHTTLAVQAQPLQDRRELTGNRSSIPRPNLPSRPIQERKTLLKLDRQIALIRSALIRSVSLQRGKSAIDRIPQDNDCQGVQAVIVCCRFDSCPSRTVLRVSS